MAEIPVERKKSFPWWLPLLALLGILGLWLLLRNRDGDDTSRTTAPTVTPAITSAPTAAINAATAGSALLTDVATFTGASNKASLIGRQAQLDRVQVQRVLSDRAFTVGPSRGQEMFALLDEGLDTAGGNEQRVAVKVGQWLTLRGLVEKPWDAEVAKERKRGLNAAESAEMKNQTAYLLVKQISGAQ